MVLVSFLSFFFALSYNRTGYNQREKISKALKSRGSAIQTALNEFNLQAKSLSKPTLRWTELVDVMFIGELDLWKDCRTDVRRNDWAKPENRRAMALYFRLLRAKEEIVRVNVEIRRQITFMVDEYRDYQVAASRLQSSNRTLAAEIAMRCSYIQDRNAQVMAYFSALASKRGFTGKLTVGRRVRRAVDEMAMDAFPYWYDINEVSSSEAANDSDGEQSELEDLLVQFTDTL